MLPDSYTDGESEDDMAVLKWTTGSIAPLLLNRQCYHEALHALYSRREFFVYIMDGAGVTIRPQLRQHTVRAALTRAGATPAAYPDSGLALVSRLNVHVFLRSLDGARAGPIRARAARMVRGFGGRRLALLRLRFTFSPRAALDGHARDAPPLEEDEIARRAWMVFAAFAGVRARKLFVEVQAHWHGAVTGAWEREIKELLRTYEETDLEMMPFLETPQEGYVRRGASIVMPRIERAGL